MRADRGERAEAHQHLAVAGDHDDAALRLREREAEAHHRRGAHRAPQVERVEMIVDAAVVTARAQARDDERIAALVQYRLDDFAAVERRFALDGVVHYLLQSLKPMTRCPMRTATGRFVLNAIVPPAKTTSPTSSARSTRCTMQPAPSSSFCVPCPMAICHGLNSPHSPRIVISISSGKRASWARLSMFMQLPAPEDCMSSAPRSPPSHAPASIATPSCSVVSETVFISGSAWQSRISCVCPASGTYATCAMLSRLNDLKMSAGQRRAGVSAFTFELPFLEWFWTACAHDVGRQRRCERPDEIEDVAPQIAVRAQRNVSRARLEEMARVARAQLAVVLGIDGDGGEDRDAQAQLDVGLADVGVHGAEDDVRLDALLVERVHHLPAAAALAVVRDDRILRELLEREVLRAQDRMAFLRDDAARDREARQHDEARKRPHGLGAEREIGFVLLDRFADLRRVALLEPQPHARVALDELLDDARQHVARVGVRRRDREVALLLRVVVVVDRVQVVDVVQDPLRDLDHLAAGIGQADDAIPLALEDLEAELRLEQLDLLAHPRLRGVQRVRRGRDVIAVAVHFDDVFQLPELHCREPPVRYCASFLLVHVARDLGVIGRAAHHLLGLLPHVERRAAELGGHVAPRRRLPSRA